MVTDWEKDMQYSFQIFVEKQDKERSDDSVKSAIKFPANTSCLCKVSAPGQSLSAVPLWLECISTLHKYLSINVVNKQTVH